MSPNLWGRGVCYSIMATRKDWNRITFSKNTAMIDEVDYLNNWIKYK